MSRNYANQTINRPNTLVSGGDLYSGSTGTGATFRNVEQKILPAVKSIGKFGIKELAKEGTSTFKPIGQAAGLAAGVGATALTGNPELLPYLGATGSFIGKGLGGYVQKKADEAIDKW